MIIFNYEPVSFLIVVPGYGRHNLLHDSVHISCPFCCSVCGLSLFIVWSPSLTELWKLHFGSDKRAGCHFDYCALWHSSVSTRSHQDGCVTFLPGQHFSRMWMCIDLILWIEICHTFQSYEEKSLSLCKPCTPCGGRKKTRQNTQMA